VSSAVRGATAAAKSAKTLSKTLSDANRTSELQAKVHARVKEAAKHLESGARTAAGHLHNGTRAAAKHLTKAAGVPMGSANEFAESLGWNLFLAAVLAVFVLALLATRHLLLLASCNTSCYVPSHPSNRQSNRHCYLCGCWPMSQRRKRRPSYEGLLVPAPRPSHEGLLIAKSQYTPLHGAALPFASACDDDSIFDDLLEAESSLVQSSPVQSSQVKSSQVKSCDDDSLFVF